MKAMKPPMLAEERDTTVRARTQAPRQRLDEGSGCWRGFAVRARLGQCRKCRIQVAAIVNLPPEPGERHELLDSDAALHGGSGVGHPGRLQATAHPVGGWPASALVTVPPLGTVIPSNCPVPSTDPLGAPNARQ